MNPAVPCPEETQFRGHQIGKYTPFTLSRFSVKGGVWEETHFQPFGCQSGKSSGGGRSPAGQEGCGGIPGQPLSPRVLLTQGTSYGMAALWNLGDSSLESFFFF